MNDLLDVQGIQNTWPHLTRQLIRDAIECKHLKPLVAETRAHGKLMFDAFDCLNWVQYSKNPAIRGPEPVENPCY